MNMVIFKAPNSSISTQPEISIISATYPVDVASKAVLNLSTTERQFCSGFLFALSFINPYTQIHRCLNE